MTGIEPGNYMLWATAGDHRSTHLPQVFGETKSKDPMARPRSNLELHPGDRRNDMNIALARALAIEGRLIDPWDDPMANVEIELLRADTDRRASPQVYSNDLGEFRLYGLQPGRYRICVTPRTPFVPSADGSRFVRSCYPGATTGSSGGEIVLADGDVTGIEIRVQRGATYSMAGTVQDASGQLADGARVQATLVGDQPMSSHGSAHAGQFNLPGLTPGHYLVHAAIGGSLDPSGARPASRPLEIGVAEVDVATTDAAGVTIQLSKGQRIRGHVAIEGGRTPFISPQQLGVQATIPSNLAGFDRRLHAAAPVDERWNFELNEIFRIPLLIHLAGLPDGWRVKSVRYGGRDITDVATDLGAVSEPVPIEILVQATADPIVR
jgi:hypothetical protein